MKVVGIIQARMRSTRLPNKVLEPLGNTVMLDYVYQRMRQVKSINEVVVATSIHQYDDLLEDWCQERDVPIYRGSEHDLLDRFTTCAQQYNADYIVRITGDCPFICYNMAEDLIQKTVNDGSQYGRVISGDIPIGLRISIINYDTLKYLSEITNHPYYREHITLYIDENLSEFNVTAIQADQYKSKNYRLTVDNEKDIELCRRIVSHLGSNVLISSREIIDFLDRNPNISNINRLVKQKIYKVKDN